MSDVSKNDFLIADFQHWSESYWREEEVGERRVNFLVTLSTAVIAGLVALHEVHGFGAGFFWVAAGALLSLLTLGIVTLMRVLRRNEKVDGYIHAIRTYRRHFVSEPLLKKVLEEVPPPRTLATGGLALMVSCMNGLVLAALGALVGTRFGGQPPGKVWLAFGLALVAFVLGLTIQLLCVRHRSRKG
jgi:heme exporter protein D